MNEREGFRHTAPAIAGASGAEARGRERWVINKIRALCSWYSKGLEGGSQLRVRVNQAATLAELHAGIDDFFVALTPQSS